MKFLHKQSDRKIKPSFAFVITFQISLQTHQKMPKKGSIDASLRLELNVFHPFP